MATWQNYLEAHQDRFLEELKDFLRIPSVSSLTEHREDVEKAARWVARRMASAGIEAVEIMPTEGHPVVYGHWLHAPGKPTVMIYGHFDTQPVDPVELWDNPPFEPTVIEDRIFARGASDDKGNMLIPILVVEAMLKTMGKLPLNLKFFFEGQEEIGSPDLQPLVESNRERLACDSVISADGGQWSSTQPTLTMGLRGVCGLQVDVQGPSGDLHSGTYGGAIANPIHALVQLLDTLHDPDGNITVEGFYDSVRELTPEEKSLLDAVPFDERDYTEKIGAPELFGAPGHSTYERVWTRPTLEINGIWGGFQGEGLKTVLPSTAHAKISCRLVPDQNPTDTIDLIEAHIQKHAPRGVRVSTSRFGSHALPYVIPLDHPGNRAAESVLRKIYGKAPYFVRMGGSIPVCGLFLKELGAYTINFAFGLKDEKMHAPNEFFRLKSFRGGQTAFGHLFETLAKEMPVSDG